MPDTNHESFLPTGISNVISFFSTSRPSWSGMEPKAIFLYGSRSSTTTSSSAAAPGSRPRSVMMMSWTPANRGAWMTWYGVISVIAFGVLSTDSPSARVTRAVLTSKSCFLVLNGIHGSP